MTRIIAALLMALSLTGCDDAMLERLHREAAEPTHQAVCINLGNGMTGCQFQ